MNKGARGLGFLLVILPVGCGEAPRASPVIGPLEAASAAPRPLASAAPKDADAAPAESAPATPLFAVAQRVVGSEAQAQPPRATSVVVGDGWGCAQFASEAGVRTQCWEAGGAGSKTGVHAFVVPWLRDKALLQGGPDRVCELARPALTFRCWYPPVRDEAAGRELPASWEWLNPNHAPWNDAYSRADWVGEAVVGGTFACLKTMKDNGVFCLGDDTFGQLGASSRPAPDASGKDPAFLQHVWPAEWTAAGLWHGCAIAAPHGLAQDPLVACWGRGDYGQLGAPAPDQCVVDKSTIPCAKTPQRGPSLKTEIVALRAGDLFTCVTTPEGIQCWGASRDAFFGKAGSCPERLRRAWPTLHGSVPAPRAACSDTPVAIPGVHGFEQDFVVGSRGLCFEEKGGLRCWGAVRAPRGGNVHAAQLSPGPDASACGLKDGGVVCWGDAYSPKGALDMPVPITFEAPPPVREMAVVGATDPQGWNPQCLVRRGCAEGPAVLPTCAESAPAKAWSDVLTSADKLDAQVVRIGGVLGVGSLMRTAVWCTSPEGRACCNTAGGPIVLGDGAAKTLALDGLHCAGDDSRACCNAPAYGQNVVATGRLHHGGPAVIHHESGWTLTDVALCIPAAATPDADGGTRDGGSAD